MGPEGGKAKGGKAEGGKAETAPGRKAGPPSIPEGRRIYAIGDVHGRRDLLDELMAQIAVDASTATDEDATLVFLGDYVDRGPRSKEVLEFVADPAPDDFERIALMGNHEEMMLRYIDGTIPALHWLANGGDATLESFGIGGRIELHDEDELQRERLRRAVGQKMLRFVRSLAKSWSCGDYFFAHAGVKPGVPLDEQADRDLMWIREEFLHAEDDFGKVVVHGHTPFFVPQVTQTRIGIDTGAFQTDRLTCLVLSGTERHFLST